MSATCVYSDVDLKCFRLNCLLMSGSLTEFAFEFT